MKPIQKPKLFVLVVFTFCRVDYKEISRGVDFHVVSLSRKEARTLLKESDFTSFVGKPELRRFIEKELCLDSKGNLDMEIELRYENPILIPGDRALVVQYTGPAYAEGAREMPVGGRLNYFDLEVLESEESDED